MNLQSIEKLVRKLVPQECIWNSNIVGDNDYFKVMLITKENSELNKAYLHLTTSVGFRRYGTWTKFNIKLFNGMTKDEVMLRVSSYVEYYNKRAKVPENYTKGLMEHIKATGGHSGNPVWMD